MTKKANHPPIYLALIHYPVTNAHGEEVCTSITPMDLHDIARAAKTYGLTGYFVVCPVESQRKLAQRIMDHWLKGPGGELNETRKQAFEIVDLIEDLAQVQLTIKEQTGKEPRLVATSAKEGEGRISFKEFRQQLSGLQDPVLLLFGTGWGMTEELLQQAQDFLEPIRGGGDGSYNHLSVRAAVAIILDRLLGS
ncbi:MAG: RNA methyltransferase [Deltaproteobacteria bacterium]|nr:RNA methyltransferase [Deltaproteobacteria bacterium]